MFPGMDPRAMKAAMKKMGMQQEEIEAEEVIIKTPSKDIVILNPSVTKINMMGQTTFQVAGTIEEREAKAAVTDDDVKTVAQQSGASEADARKALETNSGDLAAAILYLKN